MLKKNKFENPEGVFSNQRYSDVVFLKDALFAIGLAKKDAEENFNSMFVLSEEVLIKQVEAKTKRIIELEIQNKVLSEKYNSALKSLPILTDVEIEARVQKEIFDEIRPLVMGILHDYYPPTTYIADWYRKELAKKSEVSKKIQNDAERIRQEYWKIEKKFLSSKESGKE